MKKKTTILCAAAIIGAGGGLVLSWLISIIVASVAHPVIGAIVIVVPVVAFFGFGFPVAKRRRVPRMRRRRGC